MDEDEKIIIIEEEHILESAYQKGYYTGTMNGKVLRTNTKINYFIAGFLIGLGTALIIYH